MLAGEKTAKLSIVKKQLFLCICLKSLCPWEKQKDKEFPVQGFPGCDTWGGGDRKADCFCAVSFVGVSPDTLRNH